MKCLKCGFEGHLGNWKGKHRGGYVSGRKEGKAEILGCFWDTWDYFCPKCGTQLPSRLDILQKASEFLKEYEINVEPKILNLLIEIGDYLKEHPELLPKPKSA